MFVSDYTDSEMITQIKSNHLCNLFLICVINTSFS